MVMKLARESPLPYLTQHFGPFMTQGERLFPVGSVLLKLGLKLGKLSKTT